jgi:hypothetical protein
MLPIIQNQLKQFQQLSATYYCSLSIDSKRNLVLLGKKEDIDEFLSSVKLSLLK